MALEASKKLPPHFVNDIGVKTIRVSVRQFKCIGASPPQDHPHVFLDIGASNKIVCPYCSTQFVFDSRLEKGRTRPPEAIYQPAEEPLF